MPIFQLLTLPPSHYCEKARWALQRCALPFKETAHFPVFHLLFVKKLGGGTSLPKLIITGHGEESQILHDSSDILAFTDNLIGQENLKLYPLDKKVAVIKWEDLFDEVLGPNVRTWGYCYLLYHKGVYDLLTRGVSWPEKVFAFFFLPIIRHGMFKRLRCAKKDAQEITFGKIISVFEKVNEALADGRPFICGDTFTAADLTFAALGGSAVLPKGYGSPALPTIQKCPKEMADKIQQLREMPAGKHIMRMYETQRLKAPA